MVMTEKIIFSLMLACGVVWIASATPRNDGSVAVDCFASQSDAPRIEPASLGGYRNDEQVMSCNAIAEKAQANWCGVYEYAFTLGDMKVNDAEAVKQELEKQFAVQLAEAKAQGLEQVYLAYLCDETVIQGMKWQLAFVAKEGANFMYVPEKLNAYNAYVEPLYTKVEKAHPKVQAIQAMEARLEAKHGSLVQKLKDSGAISGMFLMKAKALNY